MRSQIHNQHILQSTSVPKNLNHFQRSYPLSNTNKANRSNQRDAILAELRTLDWHPTADEIYARLRVRMPKLSLGTVYRNLELLFQNGLIQKLSAAGKQNRFDGNVVLHHHMRCNCCDRIFNFTAFDYEAELNWVLHKVLLEADCQSYQLTLQGKCSDCRIKRNKNVGDIA